MLSLPWFGFDAILLFGIFRLREKHRITCRSTLNVFMASCRRNSGMNQSQEAGASDLGFGKERREAIGTSYHNGDIQLHDPTV